LQTQEQICEYALPPNAIVSAIEVTTQLMLFATNVNAVVMLHIPTKTVVNSFQGHTGVIRCMKYDEQSDLLATGSMDKTIRIWNTITGDCRVLEGHLMSVICVDFNKQANLLVSGSGDHMMRGWNLITGECVRAIDTRSTIFAIGLNSRFIVTSDRDPSIKIWDLGEWTPLCHVNLHRHGVAGSLLVDDTKIVTGSKNMLVFSFDSDDGAIETSQTRNRQLLETDAHRRPSRLEYLRRYSYFALLLAVFCVLWPILLHGKAASAI